MLCTQLYSRGDDIAEIKFIVLQMIDMFKLRYQVLPTLELDKEEREMWKNLTLSQLYGHFTCLAFATSQRYPADVYANLFNLSIMPAKMAYWIVLPFAWAKLVAMSPLHQNSVWNMTI
jgi:hypothetical protein